MPDEMLGGQAVCPYCRCLFIAPTKQADGTLSQASLLRKNPFSQSKAFAPGMFLILFGSLTMIWNGSIAIETFADPATFEARTRHDFHEIAQASKKAYLKDKDPEDKEAIAEAEKNAAEMESKADVTLKWLPWARVLFVFLSTISLIGGIGMIRKRWHSLAMLGSVAAMFNVLNYFCIGGMPIGAWALFVLMNPIVRDSFDSYKTAPKS